MIRYSPGKWHVLFIFAWNGSVFPKGVTWATPSAMIAVLVSLFIEVDVTQKNLSSSLNMLWSGYSFVLGFLIVFRTQQAYSRFWEGTTLLHKVRATWFNAVSSLFAFCSTKKDRVADVESFQQLVVRLVSLLFCSALQQVADLPDEHFEILDQQGVQTSALEFLHECGDMKLDVITQWIQKLIVMKMEDGVLPIPPPVISRVFQELSNGIVDLNNAQKLTDILFPFPYAQMVTTMLLIATVFTPVIAGTVISNTMWAACLTFVWVFSFWSINYIAAEIELPFGDDANDLPVAELQRHMNKSLMLLLYPQAQQPPVFEFDPTLSCGVVRCHSIGPKVLSAELFTMKSRASDSKGRKRQTASDPVDSVGIGPVTESPILNPPEPPAPRVVPYRVALEAAAPSLRRLDSVPEYSKPLNIGTSSSHETLEPAPLESVNDVLRPPSIRTDMKDRVSASPREQAVKPLQQMQLRTEAKDRSDSTVGVEPKIASCLQGIEELLAHIVRELEVISTVGERLTHTKGVADESESGHQQPPDLRLLHERFVRPHDSLDPDPDLSLAMHL